MSRRRIPVPGADDVGREAFVGHVDIEDEDALDGLAMGFEFPVRERVEDGVSGDEVEEVNGLSGRARAWELACV